MAESKKTVGFWVGAGMLGKIKTGEPVLEGDVDPKTIAAQKKAGNIKEFLVSENVSSAVNKAEEVLKEAAEKVSLLEKQIKALEKENSKLKDDVEKLKSESEEVLKAENETLKADIKKLKKDAKK